MTYRRGDCDSGTVFQYVAVLVGDSALQLCIIVERLIFGDCDDLV